MPGFVSIWAQPLCLFQVGSAKRGWVPGFALSASELPSVAAPTLMIYGTDDPVGSSTLWDKFAGSLSHGTLWTAPGCGHLPWYDKPREVAGQVLSFL